MPKDTFLTGSKKKKKKPSKSKDNKSKDFLLHKFFGVGGTGKIPD